VKHHHTSSTRIRDLVFPDTQSQTRYLFVFWCPHPTLILPSTFSVSILATESYSESVDINQQDYAANTPGTNKQSTKYISISRDFKQRPSDTYPIYWVKPKVGTHRNNAARSGPVRSHIMREFHRRRPCKRFSTSYSQEKCLKLLAPKRQSLSPDIT
jgi:hypothetical protein